MAQLRLVQNLVIRLHHLHCLQSWLPGCIACIATLPWNALLALSVSIELVSSSARVTSVKFQKGVWRTSGPIDRTPGLPESDKNQLRAQNVFDFGEGIQNRDVQLWAVGPQWLVEWKLWPDISKGATPPLEHNFYLPFFHRILMILIVLLNMIRMVMVFVCWHIIHIRNTNQLSWAIN